MLSTRTWRTTPRAPASSLISTTFLVVRRLTMASAIRSATISSRRGIRTHTTRPRRGESRNGQQREGHARAGVARALDVDHAAVSRDERGLHRHRHAVERRLETALDAREIEQVADDPPEARRLGAHDPGHPPHLLRRERARREDLAESLERGERCPKLVRGDGDEGG